MTLFFLLNPLLVDSKTTALSRSIDIDLQLTQALLNKPVDYRPRTKHICGDKPCFTNRLILEQSPYLLQHAHNPVNWYAWGKEAFDKAKRENKAIFLSVGYAACHWCHVMEEESFDDIEIANYLNENFIAIKVDREQRPDIDAFYGSAVTIMQGQLGWPMSVFMTPNKQPFHGGSYYPKKVFRQLLKNAAETWLIQEDFLIDKGRQVLEQIDLRNQLGNKIAKIDDTTRQQAINSLLSLIDNEQGGFGAGSKFPSENWLALLLDDSYGSSTTGASFTALRNTLTHMSYGAIYDQLGGGFHRYTVDPSWKTPHFEKMLYNQALLVPLYLRADQLRTDPLYRKTASQTLDFMMRKMRDPQGGFYSSLDADSEEGEGEYYLWHLAQWQTVLAKNDAKFAAEIFDIDEYGDTENKGNILYFYLTPEEYAEDHAFSVDEVLRRLDVIRKQLLHVRDKRRIPNIDHKIIMAWNSLAIHAFAQGAQYLNKPEYLDVATSAATFIWDKMRNKDDFYRTYYEGVGSQAAQLDDYVYFLQALISLYDVSQDKHWLAKAEIISNMMNDLFWDEKAGGFYDVAIDKDAPLPIRVKTGFDKALPSANAVATRMLVRLSRRTENDYYEEQAKTIVAVFSSQLIASPSAFASLLIASHERQVGELDLPLYAARGHVRVDAVMHAIDDDQYALRINIDLDDKWHVNSHTPLDETLIPTAIQLKDALGWQIKSIKYPQHERVRLGFIQQELALYQGNIEINTVLKKLKDNVNPVVELYLQACNDQVCLAPETLLLYPRVYTK